MTQWKSGRGKLGLFTPLIGNWICNKGSRDRMRPEVIRQFSFELDNSFIFQNVKWNLGDKVYADHTLIGLNAEKIISFWSFTSDGKNSNGTLTDVTDIHDEAIGFVAQMPGGVARQAFWPDGQNGFYWAVESKTKKGWNRFVEQHYLRNEK